MHDYIIKILPPLSFFRVASFLLNEFVISELVEMVDILAGYCYLVTALLTNTFHSVAEVTTDSFCLVTPIITVHFLVTAVQKERSPRPPREQTSGGFDLASG